MKQLLLALALLAVAKAYSQEVILEKAIPKDFEVNQIFQINDNRSEDVVLFFHGNDSIKSYLFQDDLSLKDSTTLTSLPPRYRSFIGSQFTDDSRCQLFFSTERRPFPEQPNLTNGFSSKPKFGLIIFSFLSKENTVKELELSLTKEMYLESFSSENGFIIMTIKKKSDILNFYCFDNSGKYEKVTVDCEDLTFRDWDSSKTALYDLLAIKQVAAPDIKQLTFIDTKVPYSIKSTSSLSKLYKEGNKLTFMFDVNKDYTQVLTIDIQTWEKKLSGLLKPKVESNAVGYSRKSNSFLYNGYFFGLTHLANQIKLEIKDYTTRRLVQSYLIKNNSPIEIKDSPIIIMDGPYVDYREVEKTSQFFRKLKDYNIGISVRKYKNLGYQLNIGGSIPEGQVRIPLSSSLPASNYNINPYDFGASNFAFTQTVGGRMTFIKCLFDSNFDNISGQTIESPFEKIRYYMDGKKRIASKFVLPYKNYLLLSTLTKQNHYSLIKFIK
ncbi:hypothetical protein [Flagellimonas sp.]|uniref:hypothetical protein n=1 Tax=Flagellimonas sp. TaxID=2058762 RepID=UPI003B50F9BC